MQRLKQLLAGLVLGLMVGLLGSCWPQTGAEPVERPRVAIATTAGPGAVLSVTGRARV